MTQLTLLPALLALTAALPAQAQNIEDGWSVGAFAAHSSSPYVGEKSTTTGMPLISYRSGPVSISTLGLTYEVFNDEGLSFNVGVLPRFSGLQSPKSRKLKGIDRKLTGDLALSAAYEFGGGLKTGLQFRHEITGEHRGQELIFNLGYQTDLGGVTLDMNAGATWQSKDLSAYVWGVSASEAIAGRAAYDPGAVVIPFASISASAPLGENWSLDGSLKADFLPRSVTNSPIVDEDKIYSAALGVSYHF